MGTTQHPRNLALSHQQCSARRVTMRRRVFSLRVQDRSPPLGCNKCGHTMTAEEVNETENKLAMEMSKVDNRSLSEFEIFHEKLETILRGAQDAGQEIPEPGQGDGGA